MKWILISLFVAAPCFGQGVAEGLRSRAEVESSDFDSEGELNMMVQAMEALREAYSARKAKQAEINARIDAGKYDKEMLAIAEAIAEGELEEEQAESERKIRDAASKILGKSVSSSKIVSDDKPVHIYTTTSIPQTRSADCKCDNCQCGIRVDGNSGSLGGLYIPNPDGSVTTAITYGNTTYQAPVVRTPVVSGPTPYVPTTTRYYTPRSSGTVRTVNRSYSGPFRSYNVTRTYSCGPNGCN